MTELAMRWIAALFLAPALLAQDPGLSLQGQKAPAFSLKDLNGKTHTLAQHAGRPVVIMFMTSWCPFSKAMGPHVQAMHQAYKAKGVDVLVVDLKETPKEARALQRRNHFTCPVLLDEDGSVAASYAPPKAQPDIPRDQAVISSNLVVGKDGIIAMQTLLDTDHFDAKLVGLRAKLDELLAK
jgi:peroxiredoxin